MIRALQINVGVCRAAQDLALVTANARIADVLIISEQYRDKDEEDGWYADAGGRPAIAILGHLQVDAIGPRLQGIRWAELNGCRLYSCYCSPNVPFSDFEAFLNKLETSVREAKCPVIVAGDFNSKSQEWGSPLEDKRGKALADLVASLGLVTCNQGKEPTFVRGALESHIDLTFATRAVACQVSDWKVIDEESLSFHRYIEYTIGKKRTRDLLPARRGWAISQLNRIKLEESLKAGVNEVNQHAVTACDEAIDWLTKAYDASMPKSGKNSRRPVPWWNPEVTEQRKKCLKARRAYTRMRKRTNSSGYAAEHEAYRNEKKALSDMIQSAKDENWRRICELVDKDPWGHPYKIVMRKLSCRRPIPGLNLPGRLDAIVGVLFPSRSVGTNEIVPVSQEELDEAYFTPNEVALAAKSLPNGKAPGPDGIPNEVLKVAVGLYPKYFSDLYNNCIRSSLYPDRWKSAKLVLLRKPGKPLDDPSAYRTVRYV